MYVCRSCPLLLVANHKDYTNTIKRNDTTVAIGTKLNMDAMAVKSKIKRFRSYFYNVKKYFKQNLVQQRKKIILPNDLCL